MSGFQILITFDRLNTTCLDFVINLCIVKESSLSNQNQKRNLSIVLLMAGLLTGMVHVDLIGSVIAFHTFWWPSECTMDIYTKILDQPIILLLFCIWASAAVAYQACWNNCMRVEKNQDMLGLVHQKKEKKKHQVKVLRMAHSWKRQAACRDLGLFLQSNAVSRQAALIFTWSGVHI